MDELAIKYKVDSISTMAELMKPYIENGTPMPKSFNRLLGWIDELKTLVNEGGSDEKPSSEV